jgi:RimJ/RimL family protein N-acetyltransferase/ketosteroid isomerase-like protein
MSVSIGFNGDHGKREMGLPAQAELPVIETARLVLRPMRIGDAKDVFAYASDPEVLRYTTGTTPMRLEETERWLRDALADPETHMWAIVMPNDPIVVGAIEFGVSRSVGSVHYALSRPHWGKGLMTEAVGALCGWAFDAVLGLERIETSVVEMNVASARVLEKCGFRRVGVAEDRWEKLSQPVELILFRRDGVSLQAVVVGDVEPAIVEGEARLRAAQLVGDVEALDALIAEELLFTGPDGQLGTKAQDLGAHRDGVVRFREHVPEELRMRRVRQDVVVTALRARLVVEVGGVLVRGTYRYTRVWARDDAGDWRVVGGHVSMVAPA